MSGVCIDSRSRQLSWMFWELTSQSHTFSGRRVARRNAKQEKVTKITYTAYPPRRFFSTEYEKRDVDRAGPMARAMEPVVCERPLVAPKERLLGAEEVVNMNIVPAKPNEISLSKKKRDNVPHAISKGGNIAKRIVIENHTCGECWPKRRAAALINGKDKNTGMKRDVEKMKTFLSPKRCTMRAK